MRVMACLLVGVLVLFPVSRAVATGWCQLEGASKPSKALPTLASLGDCSETFTNPDGYFATTNTPIYRIPVAFHVIMDSDSTGNVDDETIRGQIETLNNLFQAIPGSPGDGSKNTRILFTLAAFDTTGSSTDGIT